MNLSLSDEQLIALRKRALLVGPDESDEEFFQRVERALPLSQEIDFSNIQKLYDIVPDWVKLIYSNHQLLPWEGGCSWHVEGGELIQLRKSLAKRERLWGIYAKEELLAHELVHAARTAYNEPRFEELLAYQTATSSFRRKVGAIIRTPNESLIYLSSLLFIVVLWAWPLFMFIALLLNLSLLTWGIIRLYRSLRAFSLTEKNIASLIKEPLPLLLHLTDKEILLFSKLSPEKIRSYFLERRVKLRFRQICARFFNE